ncbi:MULTISPECIES: NAD(P)/FAD-dependent oxidoreductase [Metallosphaera]|uniref:FAD dependent oxidoreductase n=1 Tax=Metallosphaera cuprina (strain Ar-4) TaxID=1006006 RepID=F4G165_METCR|nr:FAD dependent oxidoreductase [Metallosphaera cuprina Ar-4]
MEMNVVILGAGSHGVSLAYHLVKKGEKNVTIVERQRINYGSSGRNAGRFRYHFYTKENVEFAKDAIPYLLQLCRRLPLNPICMRTGYVWVLEDQRISEVIKKMDSLWRSLGVGGRFLNCSELDYLKSESECYLAPQDGSFHHDYLTFGMLEDIKNSVKIVYGDANKLIVSGGRISGVRIENNVINADVVTVTLGAWSGKFMAENGIRVPIEPEKKEIFITEDIRYRVKPLVITPSTYFSHTLKGEIIGGVEDTRERGFLDLDVSLGRMTLFLKDVRRLVKGAEGIRVLRGWAGYYEMTPDHSHIMGYSNEWPEGLYIDAGYSGHGMMFSPYSGKIMADLILDDEKNKFIDVFSPDRFNLNRLIDERMVI